MAPRLKRVTRLDSVPIFRASYTEEGYLKDRPILTSTGIFEYSNEDGSIRRELRLPEDVFDSESLESYKGKPIIVTHDAGLIDKDNVGDEIIGTILSEGYQDGDDVRAEIIIHDTDEMKKSRLKELSLGYNLDLEEKPGTWKGQPYDAIQRNIRVNHLALVNEARAGEQARLNIDGRDTTNNIKGGTAMRTVKKSGRTKAVTRRKKAIRNDGILSPEELQKAIEEYKARRKQKDASKSDGEGDELVKDAPIVGGAQGDDDDTLGTMTPDDDAFIDDKVATLKENKDRRDAEGDPEDMQSAKEVIAQQDDDMDILFDIIDTLLAERDFDDADTPAEPEEPITEDEDDLAPEIQDENSDEDDDELNGDDDDETSNTDDDDDDDDELNGDEDDEELNDDDDDDETSNTDDDDDVIPSSDESELPPPSKLNTDSIDRLVRARIKIGMMGRKLNMDGLENMGITKAKKKIIKAVRPDMRLDGKSSSYINAAFDCACRDIERMSRKDTSYQRRQMFNKGSRTSSRSDSADAARRRMIKRRNRKKAK